MVYNSVTACFSDRFLQQKFISISYYMSFRNSGKGCGERIPPPPPVGGGNWIFYWRGFFTG